MPLVGTDVGDVPTRRWLTSGDVSERAVVIGDVSTRVLETAGDGPPILLLHGFTDSADTWRPLLDELAQRGRRAVAVDLPGSGRADHLGRPALQNMDAFAGEFVREYGAAGTLLVGNSLGGLLALRAAARTDLPIRAVVGICPAGLAYGRRLRYLVSLMGLADPMWRVADSLPVPIGLVRRGAARVYARQFGSGRADSASVRHYTSHLRGMRDVGRLRRDLLDISRDSNDDALASTRIGVPVRLISGGKDRLVDVQGAPEFLAAVPDSTLDVLDHCGHFPQLEDPRTVADLILTTATTKSRAKTP